MKLCCKDLIGFYIYIFLILFGLYTSKIAALLFWSFVWFPVTLFLTYNNGYFYSLNERHEFDC